MEAAIISKCLDLTRELKASNISFDIKLKLDNCLISFSSFENKDREKSSNKKSPSQLKRDQKRKEKYHEEKKDSKEKTEEKNDSSREMKLGTLKDNRKTNEEYLDSLLSTKATATKNTN